MHRPRRSRNCSAHTGPQTYVAFRNVIVHNYDDVDPGIMWDMLVTKAPQLLSLIKSILADFGQS